MQIVDNNSSLSNGALEQTGRSTGAQSTASPARGADGQSTSQPDGVQISDFAGTLSQVLQSDSSDRSQRVAQLTAAVQSGTYQVDSTAVSKAIIDHAISSASSAS